MLLWITEVVQNALGADKTLGIDRQTYERPTANRRTSADLQLLYVKMRNTCGAVPLRISSSPLGSARSIQIPSGVPTQFGAYQNVFQ